ncbi:MAG: hypothetical protein IPJ11_05960 [Gemmatimonadetes bacterium]|nr:hypothetical protein [Gemmatimonadota bacterium]
MDSRYPEQVARALAALGLLALALILAGLAGHPRLLPVAVLVVVAAPLVVLAGVGVAMLRHAPRVGVTALITVAIALMGALLGR